MAIAYDAASSGSAATGTSATFSHTCTGTDRILFVWVATNAADRITGATYNGVSMTLVQKQKNATTRWVYLFRLVAPATGANNIVVSASSASFISCAATSYTGVDQTSPIDAVNGYQHTASATSATQNITTTTDNCWLISNVGIERVTTVGTGGVARVTAPIWSNELGDSNGVITPAGATSITHNYAVIINMVGIIAAFKPAAAAPAGFAYSQGVVIG